MSAMRSIAYAPSLVIPNTEIHKSLDHGKAVVQQLEDLLQYDKLYFGSPQNEDQVLSVLIAEAKYFQKSMTRSKKIVFSIFYLFYRK